LIWVSASGVAGGTPPYFSATFSAKASMDALAGQYALELARWGIETTIVVPGGFVRRVARGGDPIHPVDTERKEDYDAGPYRGLAEQIEAGLAELLPFDSDPGTVAGAIAAIVDLPFRERPYRVHVDPSDDGAAVAFPVVDRVRGELLRRLGLADLLAPRVVGPLENGR
jgi:NAD(P)-dependent dehydrogenase (short-subunit alcohol dehydrogenase family)